MDTTTITPYMAIKRMRELTALGIPFSIEFYTYNSTQRTTDGKRSVDKALLRLGLRNDQSDKADILIAYTDHTAGDEQRFFHLPMLLKFNGYTIKP